MDDRLLVLHGVALRKAGGADAVAASVDIPAEKAGTLLEQAQADGDVAGAKGMFMLTPAGRAKLGAAYPEVFADQRADPTLADAYDRFETVNRQVLDLFTRWQTISRGGERIPNDHSDPDYDAKIIDELGDLLERSESILAAFTAAVPRFGVFPQRLDDAYDRVLAGDHDYVSAVKIDSCHTVWFEMHEDLLRMLGRTREE